MKISIKQTVIMILCAILVFIPTYIAVSYYCIKTYSPKATKYTVVVTDEKNISIPVSDDSVDAAAELIIQLDQKKLPYNGIPSSLKNKCYHITVKEQDTILSSYDYYVSIEKNTVSYLKDINGQYYSIEYNQIKELLSSGFSYFFYNNSTLPSLSINGGSDVIPMNAEWKYRSVSGSMLRPPRIDTSNEIAAYPMRASTTLSFSTEPSECSVRVYADGKSLGKFDSLHDIPYYMIDNINLTFKIDARWNSDDYQGRAYYEFSSTVGDDPEYTLLSNTVQSGEFFVVMVENISAPQKIVFSSIPEIGVTPVFYKEGDRAFALIPISKELSSPTEYTFSFKYGADIQNFTVSVNSRSIYTKEYGVSISRNDQNLSEYNSLLNNIGAKGEGTRYFNGKFLDYAPDNNDEAKIADVFFGYGHKIIPADGAESYRLDGVVYIFPTDAAVPAICAGRVIHTGVNAILGNFAVVDHGFGLKTWYCNLKSISVSVGSTVAKGQSIGISGDTGYNNINGVYLITTVHNVPVSPYPLQDEGLSIFE